MAEDIAPAQPLEEVTLYESVEGEPMEPSRIGEWVKAEDHDRIVSSLQQRLARMEASRSVAFWERDQANTRAEQAEQRLEEVTGVNDHIRDLLGQATVAGMQAEQRADSLEKRLGEALDALTPRDVRGVKLPPRVGTAVSILRAALDTEDSEDTAASPPEWRTGRKVGRTLYKQLGPEPGDHDPLIGTMDTPELAEQVVAAVNGGLPDKTRERLREIAGLVPDAKEALALYGSHGDYEMSVEIVERLLTLLAEGKAETCETCHDTGIEEADDEYQRPVDRPCPDCRPSEEKETSR